MDRPWRILAVLFGLVSCSHHFIPSSVLEVTVRPGDNVTLYCDCERSVGVYIVWYRNCSHENQPSLLLDYNTLISQKKGFPHYYIKENSSSNSNDLMIINVTVADEGLYYCGTEERKVEKNEIIAQKEIYRHGSISTRITVNSRDPDVPNTQQDCSLCWKLLTSLCPTVSFLSALISALLVYLLCQKTAKNSQNDERREVTKRQREETQGEDVCYAALEIRPASKKPKRKRTIQSSDFSTYSAINTSHV